MTGEVQLAALAPRVGAFVSPVFGEAQLTQSGDGLVLALNETGAQWMLEPFRWVTSPVGPVAG